MNPTIPANPVLSELGIVFMIASIAVYGLVEPKLQPAKLPRYNSQRSSTGSLVGEESPLLDPQQTTRTGSGGGSSAFRSTLSKVISRSSASDESLAQALLHPELPNFGPYMMAADVSEHVALVDQDAEGKRKLIGIVVALVVGAVLSTCLVPYVLWQQECHPAVQNTDIVIATCNPLNFIFSQCLGIYITSTVAFLGYSLFHRFMNRSMPRSVMRPAYMCGVLWAIGLGGQLLSMGNLGFDQAFPLSAIGPAMVSMLWSALYFKEIEGRRNVITMAIATTMVLIGTALRIVST